MLENHKKICSTGSTRKNLVFFSVLTSKNVMISEVCYTKKGLSHLECFVKLSHLERFVTHRTDFHIVTIGKVCHAKKGLSHLKGCVGCVTLRKVCQTKTDMSHKDG